MKLYKITLILALSVFGLVYLEDYWKSLKGHQTLYEVEPVITRDISKVVFASGSIEAKDQVKVGSLATGVIRDLLVKENDQVEKGQLLAVIETGFGDLDVKQAEGAFLSKEVDVYIFRREYERKKTLQEKKYVSETELDNAERSFRTEEYNLQSAKAALDRAQMQYENTNIKSPTSGIVTAVGISKGERVTTDLNATVIAEIAPDVAKMQAKLNIDERDIGVMKKGQLVHLTVDAYPDKRITTEVNGVSFSPKKSDGNTSTPAPYQVTSDIDNSQFLLHPRMSVSGNIDVAVVTNVPSVSSGVFLISEDQVDLLAKIIGYTAKPLDKQTIQTYNAENPEKNIAHVWQIKDGELIELLVQIGINDGIFYQIKEGLKGGEKLLLNVLDVTDLKKVLGKESSP
jgi:HlyD family secretion protein